MMDTPHDHAEPHTESGADAPADTVAGVPLTELIEYFDAGRSPRVAAYEDSPECREVLAALDRLSERSSEVLSAEARAAAGPAPSWLAQLAARLGELPRVGGLGGRAIALPPGPDGVARTLPEAQVRAIVRRAETEVPGALIGRCTLDGDVSTPGAPLRVGAELSVAYGVQLRPLIAALREEIAARLAAETPLTIAGIDLAVRSVHQLAADGQDPDRFLPPAPND